MQENFTYLIYNDWSYKIIYDQYVVTSWNKFWNKGIWFKIWIEWSLVLGYSGIPSKSIRHSKNWNEVTVLSSATVIWFKPLYYFCSCATGFSTILQVKFHYLFYVKWMIKYSRSLFHGITTTLPSDSRDSESV